MIPSCTICKKRKKKCDFRLPSCKNCETTGAICEFYDEGLAANISRQYLKNLDDRVKDLKYEISKYEKKIQKRTGDGRSYETEKQLQDVNEDVTLSPVTIPGTTNASLLAVTATETTTVSSILSKPLGSASAAAETQKEFLTSNYRGLDRRLFDSIRTGTFVEGADSMLHHFGSTSPISMIQMASKMLDIKTDLSELPTINSYRTLPPIKVSFEFSMISKDHSRMLIENYIRSIYPLYPLLSEGFFHFDLMVKSYATIEQPFLILVLLVSSAHLMREKLDFVPIKSMLQLKATELLKTMLTDSDGDTLLALIYFAIYQTLDPEVGKTIWKTLSLACGLAEKLRLTNFYNTGPLPGRICTQIPRSTLLKVLLELELNTSFCLGRPPSLKISRDQVAIPTEGFNQLSLMALSDRAELFNKIDENSSKCPIQAATLFILQVNGPTDLLWITTSPLLSHECSDCQVFNFQLSLLRSSLNIIHDQVISLRRNVPGFYWFNVSIITIATLNIIILQSLYPESFRTIVQPEEVFKGINEGKMVLAHYCSQWNSARSLMYFVQLASQKL